MQRYSIFALARNALSGHEQLAAPRGAARSRGPPTTSSSSARGGHGLATAYYLAKDHGITNVAVLEKGWLGGGNTGRNTTICRSNYLYDESAALYEHALKLWEGLSAGAQLQRHVQPARRDDARAQRRTTCRVAQRHIHANRLNGIDNEWLTPEQAKAFCPPLYAAPAAALPGAGRRPPAPRRHGAARRRRLGLRPRGRRAGRRHHPELRGHRHPPRGRPRRPASRPRGASSRARQGRRRRRRAYQRGHGDGGPAHADREPSAAGAGLRAGEAGASPAW